MSSCTPPITALVLSLISLQPNYMPSVTDTLSPGSNSNSDRPAPRMLILCFDGTANEYDGSNTNVVKFFAMLRKDCDNEQLCYYQTGIGTYEPPGMWTTMGMWVAEMLDEAFAVYLGNHVMQGYQFLMQNYQPGDKISIFGFSRGAYTARALAGFVTKIGLLPRSNTEQVTFAYKLYERTDKTGVELAKGFKSTFCRSVGIEFLGVWDTVASTGILMSRNLPFTTNNSLIKTFRHALSLDEHRVKFTPTFWQIPSHSASNPNPSVEQPSQDDAKRMKTTTTETSAGSIPQLNKTSAAENKTKPVNGLRRLFINLGKTIEDRDILLMNPEEGISDVTDVKQVWFAGCHSDIGGGAVNNSIKFSLSDISLRWMVQEAIAAQCGILFDNTAMNELGVHIDLPSEAYFTAAAPVDSPPRPNLQSCGANPTSEPSSSHHIATSIPAGSGSSSDSADALTPVHDELKLQPLWWILEVIPFPFSWQDTSGKWHSRWRWNLGRGRYVNSNDSNDPLLFHETVRIRMQDKALAYTPKAIYRKGTETYVW